ncbi:MAG: hypothetical protein Q9O62_09505 [Ardenticatenia bacterium]|nr:hypothetical protein [Ardenticatenia bacterium]
MCPVSRVEREAYGEVDQGAGQGHNELLAGSIERGSQAGHSTKGQQEDVVHADVETAGHQTVSQLVQHDAGEEQGNQQGAEEGLLPPLSPPPLEGGPNQDQGKGDVDPYWDAT